MGELVFRGARISRGKVLFTLLGCTLSERGILRGKDSGRGEVLCFDRRA